MPAGIVGSMSRYGTVPNVRTKGANERPEPLAAEQGGRIDSGWTGKRHDGCGHRSQPDGQRVQFGRGAPPGERGHVVAVHSGRGALI